MCMSDCYYDTSHLPPCKLVEWCGGYSPACRVSFSTPMVILLVLRLKLQKRAQCGDQQTCDVRAVH